MRTFERIDAINVFETISPAPAYSPALITEIVAQLNDHSSKGTRPADGGPASVAICNYFDQCEQLQGLKDSIRQGLRAAIASPERFSNNLPFPL